MKTRWEELDEAELDAVSGGAPAQSGTFVSGGFGPWGATVFTPSGPGQPGVFSPGVGVGPLPAGLSVGHYDVYPNPGSTANDVLTGPGTGVTVIPGVGGGISYNDSGYVVMYGVGLQVGAEKSYGMETGTPINVPSVGGADLPHDFNGMDLHQGLQDIINAQNAGREAAGLAPNAMPYNTVAAREYTELANRYMDTTNQVNAIHDAQASVAAYNPFEEHATPQWPDAPAAAGGDHTQTFDDGSTLTTHADGTTSATDAPQDSHTQTFDDGSTLTTHADGTTSATDAPQDAHTQTFDDGSTLTTHADGTTSATDAPQDAHTQTFDDGSTLTTNNDGSTSATEAPSYDGGGYDGGGGGGEE